MTTRPVTVVTGASRGIGLALARRFASAGSDLVLIARGQSALEMAARDIAGAFGVDALTLALDVGDPEAPALLDACLDRHGRHLDVLVNNAGLGLAGPFEQSDLEAIEPVLAANVAGLTRLTHHALITLLRRGSGGILNVASLGGFVPGPYQAVYYATKSYVLTLTESIAAEIEGSGVRVAVAIPGPVRTGFHGSMGAGTAYYARFLPHASADRVARSIHWGFNLGMTVIPSGPIGLALAYGARLLPRALARLLMSFLLKPR
jgi:short-subunit dehydrogenase